MTRITLALGRTPCSASPYAACSPSRSPPSPSRCSRPAPPTPRPVVRRARRLLLLRRRHPHLPQRRHLLPALGLRLPEPDRGGQGLRAQLPRLLRRQGLRRDQHPAQRAERRHELRDDLGRRQRRRLHQRAHHLRPAGLAQQLQRRGRARPRATSTTPCPGPLATLYASIRAKAPNAKVVVVGYPRLFNGEDCNALTWFSPSEESLLNATADLLNSKLAAAAAARGFAFANPTSAFIGHAVCGDPEWLNGLSNPISESYHPNRTGHASGYTPLVSPLLTGAGAHGDPGRARRGPRRRVRRSRRSSGSTPPPTARSGPSASARRTPASADGRRRPGADKPGPECLARPMSPTADHKILLDESEMPTRWYNVLPDLPTPPPPPLHPGTGQPVGPGRPGAAVPDGPDPAGGLAASSTSTSPSEVLDVYRLWRPSPAVPRAPAGEGARHAGADLLQVRGRLARPARTSRTPRCRRRSTTPRPASRS